MNHENTHDLHIGSKWSTLRIDDAGYQEIITIAKQHMVCSTCYLPYSLENPMVAGTECLSCFKKREKLTYLGVIPASDPGYTGGQSLYNPFPVVLHLHMNGEGFCYETKAGPAQTFDATRESVRTLRYWHFPAPDGAMLNNKEVSTEYFFWAIDGDIRTDDVVMLEHGSRIYSNEILFLAQRNGQLVQINRRKAAHRRLLERAKEELEKHKDEQGEYNLWGEHKKWTLEEDTYRMAANLAQQEHIFPTMTDIIQPTLLGATK